jgi:putative spermidine/putrescine transport system permease protein
MLLRAVSTYLYQRPRLVLSLLLGPPLIYMLVIYLGSLFNLLVYSF